MAPNPSKPHYRCITPPPLPKHKLENLTHPAYTSLISSPVTPQSSPRPPVVDFLHEDERYALNALLSRANVHRDAEKTLLERTVQCGNHDYIKNRTVMVEWMSDVTAAFKFLPTTFHLAVRHMDWTFATRALPQRYYQLCAIAALLVAAKCEESGKIIPLLDDFRFICDDLFDAKMIRSMELYMLQLLKWDVTAKTPVHFLNHYMWIVRRRIGQTGSDDCKPDSNQFSPFPTTEDNDHQFNPNMDPSDFMSDDDDDDDDEDDNASVISGVGQCNCIHECTCDDFSMSETSDAEEDFGGPASPMNLNFYPESNRRVNPGNRRRANVPDKKGVALCRVATCLLDLSLYDSYARGKFPPHVLAATALSIASEISGDTCLPPANVAGVTDVSELGMLDCRMMLWKLFKEAQE